MYRFLAITVLLDVKDIPQVGPLQWGRITVRKVREENPTKYLEIATKFLPLVVALNPAANEFSDCQNMNDIGARMLKSVGADESVVADDMIAQEIRVHDELVARLKAIRDRALGEELN